MSFASSPNEQSLNEITLSTQARGSGVLLQREIQEVYEKSCSRGNFALNLVRLLFDTETRIKSNVNGKRGKANLNPVIMDYIKSVVFQFFPLQSVEDRNKEWASCIVAVDEGSRRDKNKPKKLSS